MGLFRFFQHGSQFQQPPVQQSDHRGLRGVQVFADLGQCPVMVVRQDHRLALALEQAGQRIFQRKASSSRMAFVCGVV